MPPSERIRGYRDVIDGPHLLRRYFSIRGSTAFQWSEIPADLLFDSPDLAPRRHGQSLMIRSHLSLGADELDSRLSLRD